MIYTLLGCSMIVLPSCLCRIMDDENKEETTKLHLVPFLFESAVYTVPVSLYLVLPPMLGAVLLLCHRRFHGH